MNTELIIVYETIATNMVMTGTQPGIAKVTSDFRHLKLLKIDKPFSVTCGWFGVSKNR